MLARNGRRLDGLVAAGRVGGAHAVAQDCAAMIDGENRLGVKDMSIPVRRARPARHYVPVNTRGTGAVARLLPRWRFVLGASTPTTACGDDLRDARRATLLSIDTGSSEHKAPAAGEGCYTAYRWALEHAASSAPTPARVRWARQCGRHLPPWCRCRRATTVCNYPAADG